MNSHQTLSEVMNEVTKTGTFLPLDENGYLISDAAFDKIVSPWREAVDYARQLEVCRLGDRLHSLYLRGSVPRGRALIGRSDLDLFAVLFDDASASSIKPPYFDDFLIRFPFAASIESSHITLADIHGPFHYYRFVVKVSAVCIHGEDLLPQIPPYTTDAPIAEEWFRIFPHLVDQFVLDFPKSNDRTKKRLCHDIMKAFLRAGMLLVMKRAHAYTRDLYPSYQCFSKHYPAQKPAMRRCLELAVNPESDGRKLLPFVTDLAEWMRQATKAEFGALELLPAELVR
jgi:hypothetical protein